MSRKTIAVDIDDVLVDRVMAIQAYLNDAFDSNLDISGMHVGESFFKFVVAHFADKAEPLRLSEMIEDYVCSDAYMSIPPSQEATTVIDKLKQTYDLAIVSYRPKAQQQATQKWLDQHFTGRFKDILLVNDGHFGRDVVSTPKAELCRDKGFHYVLDDRLDTCVESAGLGLQAVLFGTYPWNAPADLPKGVSRAKDWRQVEEYFDAR